MTSKCPGKPNCPLMRIRCRIWAASMYIPYMQCLSRSILQRSFRRPHGICTASRGHAALLCCRASIIKFRRHVTRTSTNYLGSPCVSFGLMWRVVTDIRIHDGLPRWIYCESHCLACRLCASRQKDRASFSVAVNGRPLPSRARNMWTTCLENPAVGQLGNSGF